MRPGSKAIAAFLVATAGSSVAIAQGLAREACYDAVVSARLVRQIPSVIPECGDCIVMRWPWFDDLDINAVLRGRAPKGRVTVLTMQHTYLIASRASRWVLRRNELGGFNVVLGADWKRMAACPPDTPPARAYIRPTEGRTMADLIREGQRKFGEGP